MTDEEIHIAKAVEYYISIGCRWCWIKKQFSQPKDELERLVCLLNSARQEGEIDGRTYLDK
jgi:hypothetical protein